MRIALNLEKLEYIAGPLAPARARLRARALTIACDIRLLDNLRVLRYWTDGLPIDDERRDEWYRHWVNVGFAVLERLLTRDSLPRRYCHGNNPTLADCCLHPRVFNAQRLQNSEDSHSSIARALLQQ